MGTPAINRHNGIIARMNYWLRPTVTSMLTRTAFWTVRVLSLGHRGAWIQYDGVVYNSPTFNLRVLEGLCYSFDRDILPALASRRGIATRLAGQILRWLRIRVVVNVAAGGYLSGDRLR